MHTPNPHQVLARTLLAALPIAAFVFSCGGGGGGGGGGGSSIPAAITETEPNNSVGTANAVPLGTPVIGDVGPAGDVDYFQVDLTAGTVIEIELWATRNDQATWDSVNNVPRLTLLDTNANANAKLLEHDYSGNFSTGWLWGFHDMDIPMFEVPATGTYYVAVTQDNQSQGGGAYTLRVHTISVPNLHEELEAFQTSGSNDSFATAEPITPGTIHGYHVADEDDFYKFTITGPTIVHLELTAFRNGASRGASAYYFPHLDLYDVDQTTKLAQNVAVYFYDSAIQYEFTTPGTYFVDVDQLSTSEGEYFLTYSQASASATAESEPNDDTAHANSIAYGQRVSGSMDAGLVDYFKFTGTKGDMVRLQRFDTFTRQGSADSVAVTLLESDGVTPLATGGDFNFQVQTTILQSTGTFFIKVEPDSTPQPTNYALELTRFRSATYETEPNNDIAHAGTLSTRVAGVIDPVGDADVYRFSLTSNQVISIVCYASRHVTMNSSSDGDSEYSGHGSDCEPKLEILDGTGAVVSTFTSTPATVYTESVTDPLPTCGIGGVLLSSGVPLPTGTYYVRVTDATGGSGPTFYYVLEKR